MLFRSKETSFSWKIRREERRQKEKNTTEGAPVFATMSSTELQAQLAALRLELAEANKRADEEKAAKEEANKRADEEKAAKEEANKRAEEAKAESERMSIHHFILFFFFPVIIISFPLFAFFFFFLVFGLNLFPLTIHIHKRYLGYSQAGHSCRSG